MIWPILLGCASINADRMRRVMSRYLMLRYFDCRNRNISQPRYFDRRNRNISQPRYFDHKKKLNYETME
jgi:hypothetical protein